jgi:hypothetical protein
MVFHALAEEVPKNLEFSDKTVDTLVRDAAVRWPNRPAVWFLDTRFTYRQWDRDVNALPRRFFLWVSKRAKPSPCCCPTTTTTWCLSCGATHWRHRFGREPNVQAAEIRHQLETVHAKALVFLDILYEEKIAPIRAI